MIVGNATVVIGVNVFFLLSGWCRIDFRWQKVFALTAKIYILFGSIQMIGFVLGVVPINAENILHLLDPLDYYWFMMTYIFLMLCSKLLNIIVDNWNLREFESYIAGFVVVCCIYGFFIDKNLHILKGYSFLMAMALYLLGGGLHKFYTQVKVKLRSRKILLLVFLMAVVLNSVQIEILYKLGNKGAWDCFAYNNIFVVIESVSIILIFADLPKLLDGRYLNRLASATITVYILHSTCWLTKLRRLPIISVQNKFGFWRAYLLLPVYAGVIYLLGYFVNLLYEKLQILF